VTVAAGFNAVDSAAEPTSLVAALDEQATLPAVRRLRAAAVELLDPRPGQRLLDAGCGTGDLARQIAALVGVHGGVVGIDGADQAGGGGCVVSPTLRHRPARAVRWASPCDSICVWRRMSTLAERPLSEGHGGRRMDSWRPPRRVRGYRGRISSGWPSPRT